jgi:signal transduction histidine kinase
MQELNPEQIRWAVLIACLAMLIMAVFVITFVIYYQKKQLQQQKQMRDVEKEYQRMLLETALNSEEAERRRIAQDLHDDIGTMLSLTKLSLNQHRKNSNQQTKDADPALQKVQSLLEDTIVQVRRITRDLVATTLEHFGLVAAIEEFMNRLENTETLMLQFQCESDFIPRQPKKVELALYRIMQELVNNAIKHSRCDHISVCLDVKKGMLQLRVIDNGLGFDAPQTKTSLQGGLGLRNIESRLSVINGSVQYPDTKGDGFEAEVLVPIDKEYNKEGTSNEYPPLKAHL